MAVQRKKKQKALIVSRMKGLKELEKAKKGSIVPLYKEMSSHETALDFFTKLSNYGKVKNSIPLTSILIIISK